MSLDMLGHVDDTFRSIPVVRIAKSGGGFDDGGFPVSGSESRSNHVATVQPLNQREIDNLKIGGRRIVDARKLYINDGSTAEISEADDWEFDANSRGLERYEAMSVDNRPWRNYCKVMVILRDS